MAGGYRRQSRRLSVLSLGPWSRLSFSIAQPRRRWYCTSEDSIAHCRAEEEFRTCGRLPDLEKTTPCIMGCLIYSLEKLSERKRRILFYIAFVIGGLLTLGGFVGFLAPQKGWAFIIVVSGIFILITTGILWDTMAHPTLPHSEACTENSSNLPSAPERVEDEPPPDYDSVVRNKNLPRSNSKWSLYNQTWCPSFNPKMGYDKTATAECNDVVTDAPPSYNQSQALPQTLPTADDVSRCLGVAPTAIHVRSETKIEINQK